MAHELLLHGGSVRVPLAGAQAGTACPDRRPGVRNQVRCGRPAEQPKEAGPLHEALLIRDGRIVAIGSEGEVARQAGLDAERLALEGGCVLPAFADAHVHLSSLGALLGEVNLREAGSLAQALGLIAEGASQLRPGEFLRGRGWDRNHWSDGQPTKEALDAIRPTANNPVVLPSHDGHSTWVNSAALRLAGIARDTENPPGGTIWRDADGEPTGILSDAASGLVRSLIPERSDPEVKEALKAGAEHVLQSGVAALRNCESLRVHRLLLELVATDEMPIAIACSIRPDDIEEATDLLAHQSVGDRVFIENVKIFVDGALGSQTALMLKPYEDPALGMGLEVTPSDVLRKQVGAASELGLPVAVHAIGDRAIRQALDAIEQAGSRSLRNSIEHAQLVHPDDLPRFAALGVTASVQPSHLLTDVTICERHWGRRSRYAFPIRSLLASGARVVFGSDCPVEPIDPRRSLFAATVRRTLDGYPEGGWHPEERIPLATALTCHTVPADLGSRADLVVLVRDPLAESAESILDNEILLTIVEGEVAYRAE